MIDAVRINGQGRDQLIRLKARTGIEHWYPLCRWALCLSLAEPTQPPGGAFKGEAAVEIAWDVFAGPHEEIYLALLKERCRKDGLPFDDHKVLTEQLRLHLHRGLGYLAGNRKIRSISELIGLAVDLEQNAA